MSFQRFRELIFVEKLTFYVLEQRECSLLNLVQIQWKSAWMADPKFWKKFHCLLIYILKIFFMPYMMMRNLKMRREFKKILKFLKIYIYCIWKWHIWITYWTSFHDKSQNGLRGGLSGSKKFSHGSSVFNQNMCKLNENIKNICCKLLPL